MEMSYGRMIPVGIVAALIPLAAFFFFHRKKPQVSLGFDRFFT